jgi:hypothetical protein
MQISKIAQWENNYSTNKQSFQGLWGKTSKATDIDMGINVPVVREVTYFYPFADDDEETINTTITSGKNAHFERKDGFTRYMKKDCKLCNTLDFTKAEYEQYKKFLPANGDDYDNSQINKLRDMHNTLKTKYENNVFGSEQLPAGNENVGYYLNTSV